MELLKEVLNEIKPSKEVKEKIEKQIEIFLKKINKGLKDGKAILGGSGAKGTWLKEVHDADIFVQFDYKKYKDKSNEISEILGKHLKKFPKTVRLHGSRDYFQIREKGFLFELVPILKITKARDAINITDVSPLHAKWVKKYKKLTDEIRLTKQFCKANKIYGAESYIMGFSGYICEILTIYYGGFLKLIKAASKWENKTIIDVEKHFKNKNEILFELNNSKLLSPLIVIDPVQSNRNAAAAMNKEKYEEFIQISKEFLKNPSKEFFKERVINIEELRKEAKENKFVLIDVKARDGKEDVIGGKLRKAFEHIRQNIKEKEFKILDDGWDWDKEKKARYWFVVDKKLLSETVEKQGPPIKNKKHAAMFKKKHKKIIERKRRLIAIDKRKYREISKLVKDLIKDKYVKEKVKQIEIRKI